MYIYIDVYIYIYTYIFITIILESHHLRLFFLVYVFLPEPVFWSEKVCFIKFVESDEVGEPPTDITHTPPAAAEPANSPSEGSLVFCKIYQRSSVLVTL